MFPAVYSILHQKNTILNIQLRHSSAKTKIILSTLYTIFNFIQAQVIDEILVFNHHSMQHGPLITVTSIEIFPYRNEFLILLLSCILKEGNKFEI